MRKLKLFFACLLMAVLSIGQMWGASFTGSNFSGQGVSGGGSNSAISATVDGVTYACTNGYGASATQFRCYKNSKVTISCSSTITAISFTFNGSYDGGLNTSYTNLSTNSWEVTLGSQARVTNCTVTVSSGDPSSPTISIAPSNNDFVNSVEVTLTPSEGATAYYTLDGSDPTNASTQYTVPFTLTETKTVKAIAIKGDASSEIVTKNFTKVTPMTVAAALAANQATGKYVVGVICGVTEVSTSYKNATYNISDDGTGTGMIVYRGKYLDNADVADANKGKFAVGNKVVVYGDLTKYNNANQLAQGNYIVDLVEKDANPQSIAISGNMNVTEYALNATTLDYSGLTVKALYNTGYNPVVAAENIEWSFAPALDEAGSKDITLTATVGTLSDTKNVTVTVADKELQSIAMQEDPYAPVVYCGAAMPKPTIIATFDNGTEDVTSACSFTEVDMLVPGVHTIVVSYTYGDVNKELQYELTVNPYSVEEIQSVIPAVGNGNISTSVEGVIRWIDYVNAGGFAKYSISATGSKDDADTLLIYNSYAGKNDNGYVNFASANAIEVGDKVVVSGKFCTYGSNNLKETVTKESYISSLTKKVLSNIVISEELTKTEYNVGESVSPAGLKVTAMYNTGYQKEIASYDIDWTADPEIFTAGGDEVAVMLTASYTENEVNKSDSKNATVKVNKLDASLSYAPTLVELAVGGNFEPAVLSYAEGILASEISYESSNTGVAQVATDGTVTLVENATGTATITATFAGNSAFHEDQAEYTITVTAVALEKVTVKFFAPSSWGTSVKAFTWEGYETGDHVMTPIGDGNWYQCKIEKNVPFLFYNGLWNGDNQTYNIDALSEDKCFMGALPVNDGDKIVVSEVANCEATYYIAGENLPNLTWTPDGMSLGANNQIVFNNVSVGTHQFKITNGSWYWSIGLAHATATGIDLWTEGENVGFTTEEPKDITITYNPATNAITVEATDATVPDTRYKAEQTGFDATSGKLATVTEGTHQGKEYISYEAKQGAASTAPAINSNDEIRLYQNGGLLVIGAAKGCKIDQVFLTTGSSNSTTTIGYSKTETAIAVEGDVVAKSTEWHTPEGQDADTIVIVCLGATNKQRIDVAKLDVRYTGGPAAPHHYKLVGEYATVFNQGDAFNHDNLIVYASYDELEEDLVDITAECSFSAPNMNQVGEQTIEITYNSAVVASYTITINETSAATLRFFAPVAWGDNVYAFTWADQYSGDHLMTAVEEGSRWFECELKKNVSFLIYKGNQDWSGQTVDFVGGIDGNKCYTWAPKDGNGKYTYAEVASCEMNYYLTGENLPEISWAADSKALTNNEVVFENLAEGTYRFQITNGTSDWSLGFAYADQQNSNITLADNNGDVQFTTTAAMNVTIAYNPATEKITVNGVLPPKPFEPNIKFGTNDVKINSVSVNASDEYNNSWHIVTVPGSAGQSFTQSGEYSQVGSGSKPAESITFSTTLANNDEIAKISYIAIKLGGFGGTVGDVLIKVDGATYDNGQLDGTNDVVIATTGTDPMMGREISIEIVNIDKGVKCYGIEYAYQVYEFVELKFFAPRDETNKWDDVYAYAYDANNTPYVGWPGEKLTEKDAEWYVYNAPKGYNVYFHDYAGMQTEAIENVQAAACYVPTAINYNVTPKIVSLTEQCNVDYYVAGDAEIMGSWGEAVAACKFDDNNQVIFHDVPAGSYQFKITNGTWAWSIGGNDFLSDEPGCGSIAYTGGLGNTCFKIDEVQDVTITYYPATRKICLGAITVKTTGELTAYDIDNLYVDELKYPSFSTNISDYTAADVELTFVSGDECVAFVDGQIKGTAEGTAVVKVTIAETALFTGAEATFNVTVSAVPVPPTPQYETVRGGLEANRYYTLCFNRKMEAVQGATFWTFASKDANMAYLVQEDAPYAAGKPYIIYAEAAGDLTAILSGDVETNPGVNGALHGTFSLMEQTHLNAAGENIYLLMNNQLRRVDGQSGNSLPAYRAYIALDEIANTGAPANVPAHRVRAIPMHKDVVTGFENLNATDKPVKLLIDGNIYILRGEKMYDATGRLVK